VCGYISTKVEPFLFLSLPLPHAYERQISKAIIFCHGDKMFYRNNMDSFE